jgi:F0F1-type ATP synthase epsilon subunit
MENSAQTQLYNLLVTRDFEPEMKDAQGKELTFDVLGGTVEVLNNQVMVLAE